MCSYKAAAAPFYLQYDSSLISLTKNFLLFEKRVHNTLDVELLQVHIGLSTAYKHDRGTAAVYHGQGSPNLIQKGGCLICSYISLKLQRPGHLVIDCVELGQHDAIDTSSGPP